MLMFPFVRPLCCFSRLLALGASASLALASSAALARTEAVTVASVTQRNAAPPTAALPSAIQTALTRAGVPASALAVVVADADALPGQGVRLAHQSDAAFNPASVMKLVTTYAGLDLLGPAHSWETSVYWDGMVEGGSLRGNLYVKGGGDPSLVAERLWLMMRRVQGMGVKVILGDIVLDRSALVLPPHDAAAFDGEPLKPYNAGPDALLVNFKSVTLGFMPNPAAGVAHVQVTPPLSGVQVPTTVALAPSGTACGDWRTHLRGDFSQPYEWQLRGAFAAACGEKQWSVAFPEPDAFAARAIEGQWRELGGALTGGVREGQVPQGLKPVWVQPSVSVAEVVRDINKYSNNVMAQHLLLRLGRPDGGGDFVQAHQALGQWWQQRWPQVPAPRVDNGSGLSRDARITAQALAQMLQSAWRSPVMPEFVASLPVAGLDGTMRRNRSQAVGAAHIKTGSLRDVMAIAGYVHGSDGRRRVVVAMVNHAQANAARPVMDAVLDWAVR